MWKSKGHLFVLLMAGLVMGWVVAAHATVPTITEVRTRIGENQVAYPQLQGLEDAAIQQAVNDNLIERAEILSHLVTLSTLREGGWGLVVDYEAFLREDLFSVVISARGAMPGGREGHRYTAFCYDLQTGFPIRLEQLIPEAETAVAWMEERAEETLSDEFSGYMSYSDIVPLPVANFALDENGITFYYQPEQFSLISGYSGACQFYYEELAEFWDYDGFFSRMGLKENVFSPEEARERIVETLKEGRLPYVPVKIGDSVAAAMEKYRLLREPDQYPGGKYLQMEAPLFRQVLLLTEPSADLENAVVMGIQSRRGWLFGIEAGKTTRVEWQAILGQPESTSVFSASLAYDYGIPAGESDIYTFGSHQLRLHGNESGVLHSIRLVK